MKYMEIVRTFKKKGLILFTTNDFEQITGLGRTGAWGALGRYRRNGLIESPKRGLYYFSDTVPHEFLLANKIYAPSYVSFETALAYYSIIPEVVYSITCATTKATREFEADGKRLKYMKVKRQAYTGYFMKEGYFIADPEKALADYLYFVALGKKNLNDRLNVSGIDRKKLTEYVRLFENERLDRLIRKI